jgi:hypothetical protein
MVLLARLVQRETLVPEGKMVLEAKMVLEGKMVVKEELVPKEKLVPKAYKVSEDKPVLQVFKATPVPKDYRARREILEKEVL